MTSRTEDDKPRGPRPLSLVVSSLTRPAFARRNGTVARLAADWVQVVGPALAAVTHPEKLTGSGPGGTAGTLAIRAPSSVAFELQHLAPQLIERINAWAGHGLVGRLRFTAAAAPVVTTLPPLRPPPSPETLRRIASQVENVPSPELRAALEALGRAIASEPPLAPGAASRSSGERPSSTSG